MHGAQLVLPGNVKVLQLKSMCLGPGTKSIPRERLNMKPAKRGIEQGIQSDLPNTTFVIKLPVAC